MNMSKGKERFSYLGDNNVERLFQEEDRNERNFDIDRRRELSRKKRAAAQKKKREKDFINKNKHCEFSKIDEEYRRELLLWTVSSIQHIELLIGSKRIFCVSLSEEIRAKLDDLICKFTLLKEEIACFKNETEKMIREFLKINTEFIKTINRIMFEEYLCSTELFEIVNHFMIEQIYASRAFIGVKKSPNYIDKRYVLGPNFYTKEGMGDTKKEVMYNTFYFWNVISAQHCSILENILRYYNCDRCKMVHAGFANFKKAYLNLNRKLGENFKNISEKKLKAIGQELLEVNVEFLTLLYSFTPLEIGTFLPEDTPEVFFEFKEHVVEEQEYICKKLRRLLQIL